VSSFDPAAVWPVVWLTLRVAGTALLLAALAGVPLGAWLALVRFRGRRLPVALVYTGMGLPPVVVGLVVYLVLSRSGPPREIPNPKSQNSVGISDLGFGISPERWGRR